MTNKIDSSAYPSSKKKIVLGFNAVAANQLESCLVPDDKAHLRDFSEQQQFNVEFSTASESMEAEEEGQTDKYGVTKRVEETVLNPELEFKRSIDFVNKANLMDPGKADDGMYKAFLDAMMKYRDGIWSIHELKKEIEVIFRDHRDLMEEFSGFLSYSNSMDVDDNVLTPKKPNSKRAAKRSDYNSKLRRCIDFINKIKKADSRKTDKGMYKAFLDAVMKYKEGISSIYGLINEIETVFEDHDDLKEEFIGFLRDSGMTTHHETDLSRCERLTPSYCLLPAESRVAKQNDVLNDQCVSVGSTNEEYPGVKRNPYEEAMFRCEDDMFESNMLLESLQAAIGYAEDVLKGTKTREKPPVRFYGLIERLYADQGLKVVKALKRDPNRALRVILPTLERKKDELSKAYEEWQGIWKDAYAQNDKKSRTWMHQNRMEARRVLDA